MVLARTVPSWTWFPPCPPPLRGPTYSFSPLILGLRTRGPMGAENLGVRLGLGLGLGLALGLRLGLGLGFG